MSIFLTIWFLLQAATLLGVINYWHHLPSDRQEAAPDGAVMILSLRDDWESDSELVTRLRAQRASFRLLLATSGHCAAAEALAAAEPDWVQIVRAGVAGDEGQKVHKIRAALAALRAEDCYLVFIDADIEPPVRLVGRLLFPLVRGKADIVTGYRLVLPAGHGMPTLVGAVELQLATLPRAASSTMPWGGAMAMTRAAAERIDIDAALAGRLSDDMAIGLAGWRAKLRMRPVRDLLVASPLDGPIGALWRFGVRQYRHIITSSPGMWAAATGVVALQSGFWLWALVWGGWPAIAIGYGAAWGRAMVRRCILGAVLEPTQVVRARRSLWWDVVAPFVVCWAHLAVQVQASFSNRISWGGWSYRVVRGRVMAMRRE